MLTDILSRISKTGFTDRPVSSTARLLFDIQMWLLATKQAVVEVRPIDDWDHYTYRIYLPDLECPFFEPEYDRFNEFGSYVDALEAGIYQTLKILDLC